MWRANSRVFMRSSRVRALFLAVLLLGGGIIFFYARSGHSPPPANLSSSGKSVLVCGGAGYIGSHVVRELIREGIRRVIIIDNLSKGHIEAITGLDAVFFKGDVRDAAFLDRVFLDFPDIVAVVHLCADIEAGESMIHPLQFYHNNVYGAIELLLAMERHHVKQLIFSSTAAVYGNPDPPGLPLVEISPKRPTNAYGETKLAIEQMLRWCEGAFGLRYVALRYFNAAGAHPSSDIGEAHTPETHLIPIVLQVALGQRDFVQIYGEDYNTSDGSAVRDYIHVMDLASAHLLALEYLSHPENPSNQFNLGTGHGYTVKEVIAAARAVTSRALPARSAPRRAGDPEFLVAGAGRARAILHWTPQSSDLTTIVGSAWEWHRTHPHGYRT